MEKQVWKFPLPFSGRYEVALPAGAVVLTVQDQPGLGPMLWAMVTPGAALEKRAFGIFGTGQPVRGNLNYVSTFLLLNGALVYHAFEVA